LSERQREQDFLQGAIIGIGLSIFSSIFYTMWDRLYVQSWDLRTQQIFLIIIGIALVILILYFTLRLMSLSKVVQPKKEIKEEIKVVDKEEHKNPNFQLEIELQKNQIFADMSQNKYYSQFTTLSGLLFTVVAIIYTLYSVKLLPLEVLTPVIVLVSLWLVFQVREAQKEYNKDLININSNLISIQEEKQLPSLEELLKGDKEKKPTTSETN
jgi:MFS family permease